MRTPIRIAPLALALGMCALSSCGGTDPRPVGESAPRPHIVFLLADDLGWRDVGHRGGRIPTPHIDALAQAGVRLGALYANPMCTPTRAALMTGRYPMRFGLQSGVIRPHSTYGMPLTEVTLAQVLKNAGYATALVGKWHLGHLDPEHRPTWRGFDRQYGCYNGAIDYGTKRRLGGIDWHRDDRALVVREASGRARLADGEQGYVTDLLAREAVRIIDAHDPEEPLFLYVPFTAPHAPLQAPPEQVERFAHIADPNRRVYAAMVHRMDFAIGQILDALERCGMRDDTLVVFASDNGGDPELGASNEPLTGGKRDLGEGGVRVLGVVAWPGVLEPRTVTEPVSFVDWLPTFAGLAGAALPPTDIDGVDIFGVLAEGRHLTRDALLIHLEPDRAAVRSGPWKLVTHGELGDAGSLYDVVVDANETNDRAAEYPGEVRRLSALLRAWSNEAAPAKGWPSDPPPDGFLAPEVWGE